MHTKSLKFFFSLIILIFLSSCKLGFAGALTSGPLEISVNSSGEIQFAVKPGMKLPTPIGMFEVYAIADPTTELKVSNSLTVRLNCRDHIFDLQGQDFTIDFQPGYYEKVQLTRQGNNIFLELKSANGSAIDECPLPSENSVENTPPTEYLSLLDQLSSQITVSSDLTYIEDGQFPLSTSKQITVVNRSDYPITIVFIYWALKDQERPPPGSERTFVSEHSCFSEYLNIHYAEKITGPSISWMFMHPHKLIGQDANSEESYTCSDLIASEESSIYAPVCVVLYPLSQEWYDELYRRARRVTTSMSYGGDPLLPLTICEK